jgi:gamma-glutamylcyclotransferase (GGCT)/AIG2-like uncharacterized protein YtfP
MEQAAKSPAEFVYLFVYGTLKRGEPGHELMAGAQFVSTVLKTGMKFIRDAEYPSAIETNDSTDYVVGEIWAVPAADLPLMDEYEGENYKRVILKDSNLYAYVLRENESDKFATLT